MKEKIKHLRENEFLMNTLLIIVSPFLLGVLLLLLALVIAPIFFMVIYAILILFVLTGIRPEGVSLMAYITSKIPFIIMHIKSGLFTWLLLLFIEKLLVSNKAISKHVHDLSPLLAFWISLIVTLYTS